MVSPLGNITTAVKGFSELDAALEKASLSMSDFSAAFSAVAALETQATYGRGRRLAEEEDRRILRDLFDRELTAATLAISPIRPVCRRAITFGEVPVR